MTNTPAYSQHTKAKFQNGQSTLELLIATMAVGAGAWALISSIHHLTAYNHEIKSLIQHIPGG